MRAWKRHGYTRLPEPGPTLDERRRLEREKQARLGYAVTILNRGEEYRYEEPGRSLIGDITRHDGLRLYLRSLLHWENPPAQALTAAEYERVLTRVSEFLASESPAAILVDDRPPVAIDGAKVVETIVPRIACWRRVEREGKTILEAPRREPPSGDPKADNRKLPPGQYEIGEFPRFGLAQFARRFPKIGAAFELGIRGDVDQPVTITDELQGLPRVDQVSDFHCVTTWTYRSVRWSGFLFSDFYERIAFPRSHPHPGATFVIFRCQDGYAVSLPLPDLLAPDVLLADRMDGQALSIAHGAPLRLVAPRHYGYKSAKHLRAVELWRDERTYRRAAFKFMDHPRARVELEERGRGLPGPLLRYLYRPLVRPTVRRFRRALEEYLSRDRGEAKADK